MKEPYVYTLASRGGTLYIGLTSDLRRRVHEHREGLVAGFISRYNVTRLVCFEEFPTMLEAIAREKQLKGWRREKKVTLIEAMSHGGVTSARTGGMLAECAEPLRLRSG